MSGLGDAVMMLYFCRVMHKDAIVFQKTRNIVEEAVA